MATTTNIGRVRERSSGVYTAVLKDEVGLPIPAGDLETLRLSLYDVRTQTVINERNLQDVLNDNDVSINVSGILRWNITPEDHIIVGIRAVEIHRAVFDYTWTDVDNNPKRDWHALMFTVEAETVVTEL